MSNILDFEINSINKIDDDPFSRQKLIRDWDQDKVKNAKVLVVGAGALGNEVLKNLALIGIGNIFIVDFDLVVKSNLSRTVLFHFEDIDKDKAKTAAERTRELCIEQTAKVNYFSGSIVDDLGDGFFNRFDIAIGCVDNLEARLAISRGCWLAGIPWVDGSISGNHGNVVVFKPFETFCFRCTLSDDDEKIIDLRYSCDHKKRRAVAEHKIPSIQTLSSIIAGFQVQEALRILHGDYSMVGKRIDYDGVTNHLGVSASQPLPNHEKEHNGTYVDEKIEYLSWGTVNVTAREFLNNVGMLVDGNDFNLMFPTAKRSHDFVFGAHCIVCSKDVNINMPKFRIFADQYNKCPHCGAEQPENTSDPNKLLITLNSVSNLNRENATEKILDMKLCDLGFAALDIIAVEQNGKFRYFELSADHNTLFGNEKEIHHG